MSIYKSGLYPGGLVAPVVRSRRPSRHHSYIGRGFTLRAEFIAGSHLSSDDRGFLSALIASGIIPPLPNGEKI